MKNWRILALLSCVSLAGCETEYHYEGSWRNGHYVSRTTTVHNGQIYNGRIYSPASETDDRSSADPEPAAARRQETPEEKRQRLIIQMGIALAVKLGARPASDDTIGDSIGKLMVNVGANAAIEGTVGEAFPEKSEFVRHQISAALEAFFEGNTTLRGLVLNGGKEAFVGWMRDQYPEAAQSITVVSFLYDIYQRGHAQ